MHSHEQNGDDPANGVSSGSGTAEELGSVDCRMGFGSSCHVLYYYVDVRATSSRVYCVGDVRSDGLRSSGYLSWGMGDVIEVCKKHSMASDKSVCFRAWMVECVAWEGSWIQRPAVEGQKVRLGDLRRENIKVIVRAEISDGTLVGSAIFHLLLCNEVSREI